MATRLSNAEQQLAQDFFIALKEQGASAQNIETILKAGDTPVAHVVKAITQVVKSLPLGGASVSPHTGLHREQLTTRTYAALERSHIDTFGVLQCLSPSDIDLNCRTIGPKIIGEIESYAARHNCRLRGKQESVVERITEVFGSVKAAPATLAFFLAWVNETPFDNLCKQHSLKTLGDFGKLKRSTIEKAFDGDQPRRLMEFLERVHITLK